MSEKFIQSFVKDEYMVSTIYRESSAMIEPPANWFYETIVWKWDKKEKTRGDLLEQFDSGTYPEKAIENHMEICKDYLIKSDALETINQ